MGKAFAVALAAVIAAYVVFKWIQRQRLLRSLRIARVSAEELKAWLDGPETPLVVDLRTSLDVKAVPYAIPGAVRVAAEDLEQRHPDLPRDREIVLYCSRPNEATSARVALLLRRKGITRIRPLAAGLEGWRQRGFPLEPGGIGSIGPLQASQIGSASAFARARSSAPRRSSTRSRATASMSRYSCASSQPMVFGCLS